LGRILLEQGKPESIQESVQILEEAYQYDSSAATPDLVRSLLTYADQQAEEDSRINIYNRILSIQPGQPAAAERLGTIMQLRQQQWLSLGEKAMQQGDYASAIQAFEKAGAAERVEQVRLEAQLHWVEQGEQAFLNKDFDKAEELFRLAKDEERLKKVYQARDQLWIEQELAKASKAAGEEDWETAQARCSAVLERYPDHPAALDFLKRAKPEARLAQLYREGIDHLDAGQMKEAQANFVEITAIRPGYKQSLRYLDRIVSGNFTPRDGMSARWERLFAAILWAGLALAIEYIIYVLVVNIYQIYPLPDLTNDLSIATFIMLTAIPSGLAFFFARWLREKWMMSDEMVGLIERDHGLAVKIQIALVHYALPVAALLLVCVFLYTSVNIILYYAASKYVGDLFSNYPSYQTSFFLFSVLPGIVAYLGMQGCQYLLGAKKKVRLPDPHTGTLQPGTKPSRIRNLAWGVVSVVTLIISAVLSVILFYVFNWAYEKIFNYDIVTEMVVILLIFFGSTAIAYFTFRHFRRKAAKGT
jgi:tetratricopeptide (TPR) repeat protein